MLDSSELRVTKDNSGYLVHVFSIMIIDVETLDTVAMTDANNKIRIDYIN